jgi:hypothetical protein
MRQVLSLITASLLIYGIFEIKAMMEDQKTINLMDRAFNQKKQNIDRSATIVIESPKTEIIDKKNMKEIK